MTQNHGMVSFPQTNFLTETLMLQEPINIQQSGAASGAGEAGTGASGSGATSSSAAAGGNLEEPGVGMSPNRSRRKKPQPELWKKNRIKRERAMSHKVGPDCQCRKLQCFTKVSPEDREGLVTQFNMLGSYNAQQQFLASLIETQDISPSQRPYNSLVGIMDFQHAQGDLAAESPATAAAATAGVANLPTLHDMGTQCDLPNPKPTTRKYSAKYFVKIRNQRIPVCLRAFCSFFGITPRRVGILTSKLHSNGYGIAPKDMRGKNSNPVVRQRQREQREQQQSQESQQQQQQPQQLQAVAAAAAAVAAAAAAAVAQGAQTFSS